MTLAKVAVGIVLLVYVLGKVDISDLVGTLARVSVESLVVAFLLFGLSRFLESVRLQLLAASSEIRLWTAVEIIFISTFFNNFTASVVGDGYKVIALNRWVKQWKNSVFVVLAERVLGVFTIAVIGTLLFIANPDLVELLADAIGIEGSLYNWMAAFFVLLAVGLATVLAISVPGRRRASELASAMKRLVAGIGVRRWLLAFLFSVLSQVALAAMVFQLVIVFGGAIGFADNLLVMLLAYVTAYVPITIGSLGIREGAIVLGLSLFAVPYPAALAAALVSRVIIYLYAAAAGVWWAARKS